MGIAERVFKVVETKVKITNAVTATKILNSLVCEPLKGFDTKLAQIPLLQSRHKLTVFKVTGSEVKATETFAGGGIPIDVSPSRTI